MRLWSVHPRHLDPPGLVAAWREGLLARAVLLGRTRGYRHHPQLERFRSAPDPVGAVDAWLAGLLEEARARGYAFDAARAGIPPEGVALPLARGQLDWEWEHLRQKLLRRSPARAERLPAIPEAHPVFRLVEEPVEAWERPGGSPP
jgi:hypothetical protein